MLPAMTRLGRALAWCAGALVIHLALVAAFHATVLRDHNLTKSDRAFLAGPDRYEVLVVGDSHARNAVDPDLLGVPAANIAMGNEHILKTFHRVTSLLDQSGKTVDLVLLGIDDASFVESNRDVYHPVAAWGRHVPYHLSLIHI